MTNAHFLMSNRHVHAVAVRQEIAGQFRILEKAEGSVSDLATRMWCKRHIPVVARDSQLVSDLYVQAQPGAFVPALTAARLAAYWRPQRFVPVSPGEPVEFVSFRDLASNRCRLGIYLGHDDRQLQFLSLDGSEETVPRSLILNGTAKGPRRSTVQSCRGRRFPRLLPADGRPEPGHVQQ